MTWTFQRPWRARPRRDRALPRYKLCVMLAFAREYKKPNPVLTELFDLVCQRGFDLTVSIGSELALEQTHLVAQHDLYLLKSHAPLWVSIAGILHSQRARLLNPYPACLLVRNKQLADWWLHAAGIPTPETWITGDLGLIRELAAQRPLVIKPYVGGRGVGVSIVRSPAELATLPPPAEPVVVQESIPNEEELKVYVVGSEVFGIRKSGTSNGWVRELSPISEQVRSVALRCGQLFGLGLYGLDVIERSGGPVVIDVNYFPCYKGIPHAAALIADYVEGYARGRIPALLPGDTGAEEGIIDRLLRPSGRRRTTRRDGGAQDLRLGADLRCVNWRPVPAWTRRALPAWWARRAIAG